MNNLSFDPFIPFALWMALALTALGVLGAYVITSRRRLSRNRRVVVVLLMSLAVLIPLMILLNPTWTRHLPPPAGKPELLVLVDSSASMAADVGDGSTRIEKATAVARQALGKFADRYNVRAQALAGGARDLAPQQLSELQAAGETTDLAQGIEGALDDRPQGQAILLLSDGIHNAIGGIARVRESVEKARAMAAPVFGMTFGGESKIKDLSVELPLPRELAFVGQQVSVTATITQKGAATDLVAVSIWLDDKSIEERTIKLPADGQAEEVFELKQAKIGLYRYEVRVATVPGEVTSLNNTAPLLMRVVDEPVRLLVLEGKPYWDSKFLVRTLATDPSIELTSLVKLSDDRYLERRVIHARDAAAQAQPKENESKKPSDQQSREWKVHKSPLAVIEAERLSKYQVVVLGREADAFLTGETLTMLKRWLASGDGSLVCFRGAPSSQVGQRLGEMMPVKWTSQIESRFRVQLTDLGQSASWIPLSGRSTGALGNLPSLATVARPRARTRLTEVLAETSSGDEQQPVFTYQRVGNGRVVVLEGAGMWRWAFLAPEHRQFDEVYGVLWRSLVRWLVSNKGLLPSERVAVRMEKVVFAEGEIAVGTMHLRPQQWQGKVPGLQLTGGELSEPLDMQATPMASAAGQFRFALGKLTAGQYRVQVKGIAPEEVSATAVFDVRGNLRERLETEPRSDLMKMIVTRSGGADLTGKGLDDLQREFESHLSAVVPRRVSRVTIWDHWLVFVGLLFVWCASWATRRRSGLV